jgi:hypothetical protein
VREGEQARCRMKEHFEIRQCATRLANVYDQVLAA